MDDQRKKLLDTYVSLVGQVNRSLHSRLWWATDFSSKNRFNSRLPQLIQEFLTAVNSSNSESCSWQIRNSLLKHRKQKTPQFSLVAIKEIAQEWIKRSAASKYHFFRLLGRSWQAQNLLKSKLENVWSDCKPAYVIKTFVYDHSFAKDGTYRDAFFGALPAFLEQEGNRVVFFAEILGDFKSCLQKIKDCPNAVIIPVEYFASVSEIFSAKLANEIYRPQLKTDVFFLDYEVSDLVNAEIASYSGAIQPYQLLHYAETKNLIKKVPIKTFLLTYENNPWEKMCMLALREFSPKTEIVGYQHTVTPQASVNMFISKEEEAVIPKPDRVLTVGEGPAEIIRRYSQIRTLPIEPACALRYESLWSLTSLPRTKNKTILVALEGIFDVYHLVNFVIEQLKDKGYRVIIRTHPVLPVSIFSHKLLEPLENLPFIEVSKGKTLFEDLQRSDLTMYWGSTVSLESLWVGKPVIHFDLETMFSYDPLFDCHFLKNTVTRRENLVSVIEKIYALCDEEFNTSRNKSSEYLKQYFFSVNPQNLARFLSQGSN